VVLEGRPGAAPRYPNLCCNPEQCRAMLKAIPSKGLGLCYNPAHLIRMGIDHTRFLEEFATRVGHVRTVDTEILTDNLYEIGFYQGSLADPAGEIAELAWRYTIPGHGIARWSYIFRMLQLAGYKGAVSVELADVEFLGSEEREKAGLLASLHYLHTA
jgi:sugar phosphate isomerase/epimerase